MDGVIPYPYTYIQIHNACIRVYPGIQVRWLDMCDFPERPPQASTVQTTDNGVSRIFHTKQQHRTKHAWWCGGASCIGCCIASFSSSPFSRQCTNFQRNHCAHRVRLHAWYCDYDALLVERRAAHNNYMFFF